MLFTPVFRYIFVLRAFFVIFSAFMYSFFIGFYLLRTVRSHSLAIFNLISRSERLLIL
jgi:hypothetical protein